MKCIKQMTMAAMLVLLAAPMLMVSAQGPLLKRVEFTINTPFEMKKSGVVLPAGKYILHQVQKDDLNLFAMHKDNLMHSPIAMVRTTRISYLTGDEPQEVEMLTNGDVESANSFPVITGWTIPGMDGWEIIATVPDSDRVAGFTSKAYRKTGKTRITVMTTGF